MKKRIFLPGLAGWLFLAAGLSANADVTLPAFFSTHAVLQKTAKVPIWGKAAPDEAVTVTLDTAKAQAKADAGGIWKTTLDLSKSAQGPFDLIVEGKNRLVVSDVVVGEVWVCSGQSNMAFALAGTVGAAEEIAASENPLLREFRYKGQTSPTPLDTCDGTWIVAGPKTSGMFTAVGYFFGKALQHELKTPVGLINTNWGGTPIEAWMSSESLDKDEALKQFRDNEIARQANYPNLVRDYGPVYHAWETKYDRKDQPAPAETYAAPGASTAAWKPFAPPVGKATVPLPGPGAIWLRRVVTIPAAGPSPKVSVDFSSDHAFDTVYWDGVKIGGSAPDVENLPDKRYPVPAASVQPGVHTLAIRLFSPCAPPDIGRLGPLLAGGDWLVATEKELPPCPAEAQKEFPAPPAKPPGPQNTPTFLFNGMIAPLIPYAIQGVIWYQGESNAGRAFQYRTAFPLMIEDWRAKWGQGNFPFYWCQLPNFMARNHLPQDDKWPVLRESQTRTLALPNTGQAVQIELGEEGDIHPRDKRGIGDRLSRVALAKTYGKAIPFSGPVYSSSAVEGNQIRVKFTSTDGGLTAKTLPETYQPKSSAPETVPVVRNSPKSQLEGFAICGDDQQWKWADAKIDGETVLVSSPEVPKPVAVRYAWANNPVCNLYNGVGLPAGPFRTDDFPVATQPVAK